MRGTKAPRTRRRSGRTALLSERDLDVLTLVAVAKIITTEQIARDCFPTIDRTRRRLRQLFDAGHLQVTMLDSRRPNLISLTRRGLDAVVSQRPELAGALSLAGPIRLAGLNRHLAGVDARLFAADLGAQRQAPLVRWGPGSAAELRALGLEALRLEPDLVAEFATGSASTWVCVEIDLGATGDRSVATRLAKYATLAGQGRVDALWWVVAAGADRAAAITDAIARAGLDGWSRVVPLRQLLVRPAALPERETTERAVGPDPVEPTSRDPQAAPAVATDLDAADGCPDRWGDRPGIEVGGCTPNQARGGRR